MTTTDNISPRVRAALDDICSRSVLLYGEVQRIAFLHNASYNQVKAMLPSYRAARDAQSKAVPANPSHSAAAPASNHPQAQTSRQTKPDSTRRSR
jgi:hypothetical protein